MKTQTQIMVEEMYARFLERLHDLMETMYGDHEGPGPSEDMRQLSAMDKTAIRELQSLIRDVQREARDVREIPFDL